MPSCMIFGMQYIGWRFAAVILAVALSSAIRADEPDWFCPSTPGLPGGRQESETWFVGSIGSVGARMHLIRGGDVAKGEFYRQNDWKPVIVGGRVQVDGTLLLHDEQDSKCGVKDECAGPGVLRAQLTKTGLTGTWRASPSDQPEPMRMRVEPAPKCDVAEPRRVFREPGWPITFEYPAAWHMDADAHTISLLCPDPDRMAYEGSNVSLRMGNLTPAGNLPKEESSTGFNRDAAGEWQYEFYLAGGPRPALVEQRGGLTIIRADDPSGRGYCLVGGYRGLADLEVVLIVFDGRWILAEGGPQATEVVDLLLKSAAPWK